MGKLSARFLNVFVKVLGVFSVTVQADVSEVVYPFGKMSFGFPKGFTT